MNKKHKYQSISIIEFKTSPLRELQDKFPGMVFILNTNETEYFLVPKSEENSFNIHNPEGVNEKA